MSTVENILASEQRRKNETSRAQKAREQIEARIHRDAVGGPPDSKWRSLLLMLTERGFATRVIRKRLGLPTPLNTTDRAVLEQKIFPHYLKDPAIRNVLFVGCGTYTAHYERVYFSRVQYATIEPNPTQARFGAKRHVVAPLEELAQHFAPGSFDLIICNGVYGWGLDLLQQLEAAFAQCYDCLTDGGHLVFGWDDLPQRTPTPLEQVSSLERFERYTLTELGTWRYLTATPFRHTYDFYRKGA